MEFQLNGDCRVASRMSRRSVSTVFTTVLLSRTLARSAVKSLIVVANHSSMLSWISAHFRAQRYRSEHGKRPHERRCASQPAAAVFSMTSRLSSDEFYCRGVRPSRWRTPRRCGNFNKGDEYSSSHAVVHALDHTIRRADSTRIHHQREIKRPAIDHHPSVRA